MEQILAIIVFGLLIALAVIGLRQSTRAAETGRGNAFAMAGDRGAATGGTAGGKPAEGAASGWTASGTGSAASRQEDGKSASGEPGPERPQADRRVTSGDVGA
jgi:type IV secretory pathway TrbL component